MEASFRNANPVVHTDTLQCLALQGASNEMYAFDPLFSVETKASSIPNAEYEDPPPDFVQFDLDYIKKRTPKHTSKSPPFDKNYPKPKLAW